MNGENNLDTKLEDILNYLNQENFYGFFKKALREILSISELEKNEISSMYIVNYDISSPRFKTIFKVPIYLSDENAVQEWVVGYLLRKLINLGREHSFVDEVFRKHKKIINSFLFIQNSSDNIEYNKKERMFIVKSQIQLKNSELLFDKKDILKIQNGKILNFDKFQNKIWNSIKNVDVDNSVQDEFNCKVKNFLQSLKGWKDHYEQRSFEKILKIGLCFLSNLNNIPKSFILFSKPTYFFKEKNILYEITSGAIVIFFKNTTEIDKIKNIIQSIKPVLSSYIFRKTIYDLQKRTNSYALRSAVAAIMARNMSHNIGSHVLWYLSQEDLGGQEKEIKSFSNYIRERMGFVGLISTTTPTWAIDRDLEKDVIQRLREEKILLDNIVRSETERKFIICSHRCEKKVEMPHGVYGTQAFFVILENIIRNTVKHNVQKVERLSNNLQFNINLEEAEEEWKDDYYKITITDNLKTANDKLIKELNDMIGDDIIGREGKLNNRYLGFKEMRLCAGFLQMLSPENLESKNVPQPILKVDKNDENLAYIFYLRRPKEVLILSNREIEKLKKEELRNKGIFIINVDALSTTLKKKLTHKIFIIDLESLGKNEDILTQIEENKLLFPFRIFVVEGQNKESFKLKNTVPLGRDILDGLIENPETKLAHLWESWIRGFFKNRARKQVQIVYKFDNPGKLSINNIQFVCNKGDDYDPCENIVLTHDIKVDQNKKIYKNSYYLEAFKTGGPHDLMLGEIIMQNNKKLFYQLLESLLMKVAVVDERIWKRKAERITPEPTDKYTNGFSTTLEELWKKRQVHLMDHNNFIKNSGKFVEELEGYNPDILVMHQGVIDKRIDKIAEDKNKEQAKKEFIDFWNKNICGKIKRIVIDSDRGKPSEIKEEKGLWLDFADLSNIIVDEAKNNLSKYLLVNLLVSLREE